MKQRRLILFTALILISGISLFASASAVSGPALQVSEQAMASALSCPASFSGAHEPVLFIHGTTLTAESNWSWNYGKVLPAQGYDVCLVNLPDRARADMQVSAEYVVYAIRTMAARSQSKVDVVGFSQGPVEPRWAIKWWPDIRDRVDDLVAMAGVAHGFTETEAICFQSCIPPFWQMKPNSNFLAALNAGDETPGDVSYTSVYTRTDQFVWLANGEADPWTQSAGLEGATNIAVQDICPGRPVEHVQVVYDAAFYAVVADALAHPGPADPGRIDRAVCLQGAMPGVDTAEATAKTAEIDRDLFMLSGVDSEEREKHHTEAEPALAAYAKS